MKGAGHEQTENNGWNYINMDVPDRICKKQLTK